MCGIGVLWKGFISNVGRGERRGSRWGSVSSGRRAGVRRKRSNSGWESSGGICVWCSGGVD